MPNTQAPEKLSHNPLGDLAVHSIFPTIQGEGFFTGKPAIFLRLAGCNIQCPNCDTDYTSKRQAASAKEVADRIIYQRNLHQPKANLVVITGGEPFRQNLHPIVAHLIGEGFHVQIETNGTLFQFLPYNHPSLSIICSPKTSYVHPELRQWIKAYKYVLDAWSIDPVDGLPHRVLDFASKNRQQVFRPSPDYQGDIFVQPADCGDPAHNKDNLEAAIASAKRFNYVLGIQLHKLVGID